MLKFIARKIAGLIRCVKVNRVTFQTIDDQEFVCKTRHPLSPLLIFPGNIVLRWRKVPVRVLFTRQWIEWERKLAPINFNNDQSSPRTLMLARIPGTPLVDVLASSNVSTDQKLEVMSISVNSLRGFHERCCETNEHGSIQLSHGDATVRNLMIDLESTSTNWFDFDLRHDLQLPANARHADDLRALLFSAAHFFDIEDLSKLVDVAHSAYGHHHVWDELAAQVTSRWFGLDLFHLAHIRPPSPRLTTRSTENTTAKTELLIRAICHPSYRDCDPDFKIDAKY